MTGSHKQTGFHLLKNHSVVAYEEALKKVKFFNYENVYTIIEAYTKFIQKLTFVNNEITPCQTKRVQGNFKEWLDSVLSETNSRNKHFKERKKSRLPLDQENYKKAYKEVKKLLRKYCEKKLTKIAVENLNR